MDTKQLSWKNEDLYFGNKKTGYYLVPGMFQIGLPNGTRSPDIYNIDRAKQHAQDIFTEDHRLEVGL